MRLANAKLDKYLLFRAVFTSVKSVTDNGGVITGTPTINGKADFTASRDYVNYSAVRPRKSLTKLTMRWKGSMAFNLTYQTVFNFNNGGVGYNDFTGILRNSSTSQIQFAVGDDTASGIVNSGTLVANTIYDVVGVWNGGNDIQIYINGALVSATPSYFGGTLGTIAASKIVNMFVGTMNATTYNGTSTAKLVELYDTNLSAEEVKDLYEQDTYSEIERAIVDLPLRSWYYNGSSVAVTENKGSLGGTATLGDGTTTTTFPTQLSPKGMSFDGTTDYLKYLGTLASGTYSIVALMKPITTVNKLIVDCRASGGTGYFWFNGSGVLEGTTGTVYVNGTASNVVSRDVKTLGVSGITLSSTDMRIMASYTLGALTDGSLLALKIYPGTLTPMQMRKAHRSMLNQLNT